MYEKVLVPFDFSPDSKHAVECLKSIPGIRDVVLLNVVYTKHPSVSGEFENPDADYARLRLEEYVRSLEKPGFTVRTRVGEITGGNISDVVNRVAAEEDISLTVMGRRGQGVIESLLLGSVASDVLRYGTTDLLLIGRPGKEAADKTKPPCPGLFSHVLICTDFSDPDVVALAGGRLPRPRRVSLLHVVSHGESEDEVRKLTESAWTKLEKCAGAFSSRHVPVATAVRVGSTAEEIVAFAGKECATLIVMKSAGKRGFIPSFLGTTTAHVARAARVPVLVLKQPAVAPQ
ncbi:MAG: universal stress protein [Methanolinea sp.]|nr:universal stress protein [Methanolinea sp.]